MDGDKLSTLLSAGYSLDQIEGSVKSGITLEEVIDIAFERFQRGEPVFSDNEYRGDIWQDPIPFETYNLPSFPVETLPAPVEAFVEALAESTQTPLEMGGLLALGVMAAVLQRHFTLRVRPDWTETLSLYTVIVGAPAERKSPVLSRITKPLRDYERERRDADAANIAQAETERRILEGKKAAAEAAAVKGKGSVEDALDLAAQLAEYQCPHELRLLVDDATPEKLAEMMEQQGGSIALCSAEGGVFDSMRGRYDRTTNLDVYLKAWDGEQLTMDRIGRKSNRVDSPRLTVLLAIQPAVLSGLMSDRVMRGRGLVGRFLYAICRGKIGERKASPDPVPEKVEQAYRSFIRHLLTLEHCGELHLSKDANDYRCSFHDHVEKLLAGRWESIQEWAGKLVGTVCRIAAILHCGTAQEPLNEPISGETFEAACRIGLFLAAHAETAFGLMGASEADEDAKYILKRIKGSDRITRSELTRQCRGRFKKAADMETALEILEERNYIRREEEPIGQGRVQINYAVHPNIG